jgi:hypothetical protein
MAKILNEIRKYDIPFTPGDTRKDTFPFTIPPGETFHGSRLTIISPLHRSKAKIISQPRPGQTGNVEIVVNWECPRNSAVKYQIEAFTRPDNLPAGAEKSITRQMTKFRPSKHGFRFKNKFTGPTYLDTIFGRFKAGDASEGLCGGMVFSALDYFNEGISIPTVKDLPAHKELYDYVFKRLIESFDVPNGPLKYIQLMHPKYPDAKKLGGIFGLIPVGRAWRMIREEWPKIKEKLDDGEPCPLGLILIKSTNVMKLGENHQVLAYGYDLIDDELTLYIYDPNNPENDNVTLSLKIGNPERKIKISCSHHEKVYCFFMEHYTFSEPPRV